MYMPQGGDGGDQWHVERHGCVTGTKFESSIGACFTSAKYNKEGEITTKERWEMGGKTWEFEGSKLVCIKDGKQSKKSRDKQITLLYEIVSDRQSEVEINDYQTAEMERGTELEPVSVELAGKKHNVAFILCGMLVSDTLPMFKFSPDAIVLDKNNAVVGGYETKSKMGKKHIQYQVDNVVPPEHLMQCLCPMAMDDSVKYWIFGHYDDRNKVNELFTTGIKKDNYNDFIQVARKVLTEFLNEADKLAQKMGGAYNA